MTLHILCMSDLLHVNIMCLYVFNSLLHVTACLMIVNEQNNNINISIIISVTGYCY